MKDDLLAGRVPRAHSDNFTVADLCNQFLTHKAALRDNGEINPRTFRGHYDTCAGVVKTFGKPKLDVIRRAREPFPPALLVTNPLPGPGPRTARITTVDRHRRSEAGGLTIGVRFPTMKPV